MAVFFVRLGDLVDGVFLMDRVPGHIVWRWWMRRQWHGAACAAALFLVTVNTSYSQGGERATALNLSDARVQTLALPTMATPALTVHVDVDGRSWTLALRKRTIRSDDFQVLVQRDGTGALVAVTPPPVSTYRGSVVEVPEATVSASLRDGRLRAVIHTPTGDYGIEPLAGGAEHVSYRASDWVNIEGHTCGTTEEQIVRARGGLRKSRSRAGATRVAGVPALNIATVGIDSDFEYFEKNGSDVAFGRCRAVCTTRTSRAFLSVSFVRRGT